MAMLMTSRFCCPARGMVILHSSFKELCAPSVNWPCSPLAGAIPGAPLSRLCAFCVFLSLLRQHSILWPVLSCQPVLQHFTWSGSQRKWPIMEGSQLFMANKTADLCSSLHCHCVSACADQPVVPCALFGSRFNSTRQVLSGSL